MRTLDGAPLLYGKAAKAYLNPHFVAWGRAATQRACEALTTRATVWQQSGPIFSVGPSARIAGNSPHNSRISTCPHRHGPDRASPPLCWPSRSPALRGQATAADDLAPLRVAQADDAYRPGGTASATTPIGRMTPPGTARSTPGDRQADDAYRPEADTGGAVPDDDGAYRPRGGGNGTVYRPAPPRGSGGYGEPYAPRAKAPAPPTRRPPAATPMRRRRTAATRRTRSWAPATAFSARSARAWQASSSTPSARPVGRTATSSARTPAAALIAGLRYGEGILHTKDAGHHKVYWQGPSVGYDFGAEGSKTMVLVYNLRDLPDLPPVRRRRGLRLPRRRRQHPVPAARRRRARANCSGSACG